MNKGATVGIADTRENMLKKAAIGIASDFDEHVLRKKVRAAMESESYVEVKEEAFPFITCYMCESSDCEEIRLGNKKYQSTHVLHLCKQCQRKMGQLLTANAMTGPVHSFQEFYDRLECKTAEEIIRESGFDKVKAYENIVKDDEFFSEFLESIHVEIKQYGKGVCLLQCENKYYEVPHLQTWTDWGEALSLRHDTIYDVTDAYES